MIEFLKQCACGLAYDRIAWERLPLVSVQVNLEYRERETLRNCSCRSTLMLVECIDCDSLIAGGEHSCPANDNGELFCAEDRRPFWWLQSIAPDAAQGQG